MIRLHETRLMREGEVVLWLDGKIVWSGPVGTITGPRAFDTVTLHVSDGERMKSLAGEEGLTEERALALLSHWWQCAMT
jgi:hypothetical protein